MRFLTQIFIVMTNINQTNFLLSLFFYEESIIVLIKNLKNLIYNYLTICK